jgi:hypothetical protein
MLILARSGSISHRHGSADPDPDPDPHQNVMDPDPLVQRHRSGSGSKPKKCAMDPQHCLPHDDVAHLLEAGNDQASVVVVEARSALLPTILQVAEVEEMHFCRGRLMKEAVALQHLCFD